MKSGHPSKPHQRSALPLPAPPRVDKSTPVASLRAYRRARGLCDKCAEKWHPCHKCSSTVQLNALQEVFDLFADDSISGSDHRSCVGDDVQHQDLMLFALSRDALSGSEEPRTMKFQGSIQGHRISILVDSGSSHTFLCQKTADKLEGVCPLPVPIQVQVANRAMLQCHSYIPGGIWSIKEYSFTSDIKVIPLEHYDLIIGMDWLEAFSPMKVHWQSKWMVIPYNGSTAFLQGITSPSPDVVVVQVCSLAALSQDATSLQSLPPEIAAVLSEFEGVFAPISGLPPQRSCDHAIPLVAGAKPVFIRPYWFPQPSKMRLKNRSKKCYIRGLLGPATAHSPLR